MTSKPRSVISPCADDTLDLLFFDCVELETLVEAIKHRFDMLNTIADCGLMNAEHLMTLAVRIENAERGLITIAHQIDDSAANMMRRQQIATVVH
ncbi:MAG: hypothetical protein ACR2QJ_12440 [Geminicoccaceae bacterium]